VSSKHFLNQQKRTSTAWVYQSIEWQK
jgi:hypothetical protein